MSKLVGLGLRGPNSIYSWAMEYVLTGVHTGVHTRVTLFNTNLIKLDKSNVRDIKCLHVNKRVSVLLV